MKQELKKMDFYLKNLYELNQYLGGDKRIDFRDKDAEFKDIIKSFHEEIFGLRQNQKLRNHMETTSDKNNPQLIRLNHEIREAINNSSDMIVEAERRGPKSKNFSKLSPELQSNMKQQLKNCLSVLQDAKRAEERGDVYRPVQPITMNDLKKRLIGDDYDNSNDDQIDLQKQQAQREFDANDQEMDTRLDRIIQLNDQLTRKLLLQGEMIDHTNNQIKKTTKVTDIVQKKLVKAENDLMKVLKNYRRPNKLCLDITLIVLLLGLIAVIVNMVRSSVK